MLPRDLHFMPMPMARYLQGGIVDATAVGARVDEVLPTILAKA